MNGDFESPFVERTCQALCSDPWDSRERVSMTVSDHSLPVLGDRP